MPTGAGATIVNIAMYLGSAKVFEDTIYGTDGSTPQDITGWGLAFVVHKYGDQYTTFITKTTGGGGIALTDPQNGVLQVTLAETDTVVSSVPVIFPGQYEYYIQRTDVGNTDTLSRGLFTLFPLG